MKISKEQTMRYFLLGGAPNVGKTQAVRQIAKDLLKQGFEKVAAEGTIPLIRAEGADFRILLEGTDTQGKPKRIIVNSPADTSEIVDDLTAFIEAHKPCDVIISAVRCEPYEVRDYFFEQLNITLEETIELPLAAVPKKYNDYETIREWYHSSINCMARLLLGLYHNLF